MSAVALYTHADCLRHDPGAGHPESPQRLAAVLEALAGFDPARLQRLDAPLASHEQLARVHSSSLIDALHQSAPSTGQFRIDADTVMSPASLAAGLRAAGAVVAAVDGALDGSYPRAFCAIRPPGHHATHAQAMGFCLFNNVAVGAMHALARGLDRVAIVDFDVHHGNGTQDIFWREPRVLYTSIHQSPLYPGSGAREETGSGNILNLPLPPDSGSSEFRHAFVDRLLPSLDAFAPQLLLVSAGFDAHRLDPLANLNLDADDYAWATNALLDLARRHARGRLVSSLEGGYSLTALKKCAVAHVQALVDGD